jgi:hypothetical protein
MLGLVNSLSLQYKGRIQYDPAQIATHDDESTTRLVAWYDFSDPDTMFTDPAVSTGASDGDRIRSVSNKAFDGLTTTSTSLNKYISNPGPSSTTYPVWTAVSGLNPGYLTFAGTEYLFSSILAGQCSTGRMGGVTLNHENHTISFVVKNANVTETTDHFYVAYQNSGRRLAIIGIESTDDQMHYWPEYSGSDIDSNAAYSTNIDSWTIIMGEASATGGDVRKIRIYKNGILTDTDLTDFSGQNKDLTANAAHVEFRLGASPGSTDQFVGRMFEFVQYDEKESSKYNI